MAVQACPNIVRAVHIQENPCHSVAGNLISQSPQAPPTHTCPSPSFGQGFSSFCCILLLSSLLTPTTPAIVCASIRICTRGADEQPSIVVFTLLRQPCFTSTVILSVTLHSSTALGRLIACSFSCLQPNDTARLYVPQRSLISILRVTFHVRRLSQTLAPRPPFRHFYLYLCHGWKQCRGPQVVKATDKQLYNKPSAQLVGCSSRRSLLSYHVVRHGLLR